MKQSCPSSTASAHSYAVFDLPPELLATVVLKDSQPSQQEVTTEPETLQEPSPPIDDNGESLKTAKACSICNAPFADVNDQRQHVKSDWHNFNLKRKLSGGKVVTEGEFEKLIDELDESISGSGSESSSSDGDGDGAKESTLSALLKKQARLKNGEDEESGFSPKRRKRGSGKPPLIWFGTRLLPTNTSLGIYRAIFKSEEVEAPSLVEVLKKKQLQPVLSKPAPSDTSNGVPLPSTMTSPSIFLCMVGGGHFAGMIVSLAPKLNKQAAGTEQRQAIVIAHKTFHRYTTRRKQGGGQSANDSAKGAAHSAGSSLRRYNEVALEQEIRSLLSEWRKLIDACQLVFVRATGSNNRRTLFGPYEGQVLRHNDPRNRTFPFSTRRATQAELMRSFVELTRVKVSEVDEAALAAAATAAASSTSERPGHPPSSIKSPPTAPTKPTKEEESAVLHTSQLQALIRRSKAPALITYLSTNKLSPDFHFFPPEAHTHHHASTPLQLAASINSGPVVLALLTKALADPTLQNGEGKVPFDLAGDRATRDAFRVARSELGEDKWDWSGSAHVPPALTKADAERRGQVEKAEEQKTETERRKVEEERLKREGPVVPNKASSSGGGGGVAVVQKTAEERREEEGRGMTEQMRVRLERERRARAAEARFAKVNDSAGGSR